MRIGADVVAVADDKAIDGKLIADKKGPAFHAGAILKAKPSISRLGPSEDNLLRLHS